MRKEFNITTQAELESFYSNVYLPHMEVDHSLPQPKRNKSLNKMALMLGFGNYSEALAYVNKSFTSDCQKCGCKLNGMGFCTDLACIYFAWTQDVSFVCSDHNVYAPKPEYRHLMRVHIDANIQSDDSIGYAEFDCAEYFYQLDNEALLKKIHALHKVNWGGDYDADEIAHYFNEDSFKSEHIDLIDFFKHIDRIDSGFECRIDSKQLLEWLKLNRPEVAKQVESLFIEQ